MAVAVVEVTNRVASNANLAYLCILWLEDKLVNIHQIIKFNNNNFNVHIVEIKHKILIFFFSFFLLFSVLLIQIL